MPKTDRVVFLDRDGTLIHDAHYLTDPAKVRFYAGVPAALRALRENGFKLVIVSNQSGIARGWVSKATVHRIHRRLSLILSRKFQVRFDGIYFCPHAPWDNCLCRKPKPGLIHQALKRLHLNPRGAYVIGDKLIDIHLGKQMSMKTILVLTGHGKEEARQCPALKPDLKPDFIARRFSQGVRWILKQ